MTNPIKCDCGYWDRDRPHSRLGGGACKYAYELLRQENERLRQLATQRGARMQKLWNELRYADTPDPTFMEIARKWFNNDGVPVE